MVSSSTLNDVLAETKKANRMLWVHRFGCVYCLEHYHHFTFLSRWIKRANESESDNIVLFHHLLYANALDLNVDFIDYEFNRES